jgi:class 3 adenylate cyclase
MIQIKGQIITSFSDAYFFGYGSLVNRATHVFAEAHPAQLRGWRRVWRHTEMRPVAFLTALPDPQSTIDGLIAAVPGADWPALDLGEVEDRVERVLQAPPAAEERRVVTVMFADLVGYTALAARVDPSGLDDLLDAFEQRVVQATATDDDVTVVKFLGDAAMFVATNLRPLIDVLLLLSAENDDEDQVPIRAGVARGEVLLREGDYYGTPVNIAARLTDLARPWSLLADESLRDDLETHYEIKRIRPTRMRGLGAQRPLVVRAAFDLGPVDVHDD